MKGLFTSMEKPLYQERLEAVLQEFIADVLVVGVPTIETEWPDLVVTYRKALEVLGEDPI